MNNSSLSQHINAAISLYEDLLSQEAFVGVNAHLLAQDIGVVSDFFKIINEFELAKAKYVEAEKNYLNKNIDVNAYDEASSNYDGAIDKFNIEIDSFLKTYGASLEGGQISIPAEYETDLDQQACVYFIAYLFKNYPLNDGKVQRKEMDQKQYADSQNNIKKLTERLENEKFSAAYRLHSKLENIDPDTGVPALLLKDAELGNMDCRYALAERYLGFLASTTIQKKPPEYKFPQGLDKERIIEWIVESRDAGHVYGLSNMQNNIDNVIGALGALFQDQSREEKKVSEDQKIRLLEMAEIVQKISGDDNLNEYIESILKIQYDSESDSQQKDEKYKNLKSKARDYLEKDYSKKFAKQATHVDKTLAPIYEIHKTTLQNILKNLQELQKDLNQGLKGIESKLEEKLEQSDENASLIDEEEISLEDSQSMLQNNLAEIESVMKKMTEILQQHPISAQSYRTTCLNAAMAVNKLRVEIYYQPHPSAWKQSVNNAIDSILQKIRPREHKPYMLFLDHEQKVKRQAVKIAKEGLKNLNKEEQSEPILKKYLKETKAEVVKEKRQTLASEKESKNPKKPKKNK